MGRCVIPAVLWSYGSGVIYAIAWLLLLDAQLYDSVIRAAPVAKGGKGLPTQFEAWYWTVIILPIFGWLGLNAPDEIYDPRSDIAGDTSDLEGADKRYMCGRIIVLVFALIMFLGVAQGTIIMILELISKGKGTDPNAWAQVTCLMHPMLAVVSAFVFFIGRVWGDYIAFGGVKTGGF